MTYSMQLRSPSDAFGVVCTYAMKKVSCPLYILLIKALMGGWFAGLGGHAASVLASNFYHKDGYGLLGPSKLAFGVIFSGALVAIIFTGADLFTGNTMAMSLLLYGRKISLLTYLSRMAVSLVGNYTGAVIAALLLTGGTGYFTYEVGPGFPYMKSLALFKTGLGFGRVICSAIGCNTYVCLAVWCTCITCDSAGSILSQILFVSSFAVAGFEHIIANFYILHAAWISNTGITFYDMYVVNFIPTFIGNYLAGACVLGIPLYVLYHEKSTKEETLPL